MANRSEKKTLNSSSEKYHLHFLCHLKFELGAETVLIDTIVMCTLWSLEFGRHPDMMQGTPLLNWDPIIGCLRLLQNRVWSLINSIHWDPSETISNFVWITSRVAWVLFISKLRRIKVKLTALNLFGRRVLKFKKKILSAKCLV